MVPPPESSSFRRSRSSFSESSPYGSSKLSFTSVDLRFGSFNRSGVTRETQRKCRRLRASALREQVRRALRRQLKKGHFCSMSLYSEGADVAPPLRVNRPRYRTGTERAASIATLVAALIGLALLVLPAPYVLESPGPVYNTRGTAADESGKQVPLMSITGTTVYPTTGSLNLLTVSLSGTPDSPPSWWNVIGAWIDPTQTVQPMDLFFPPGVSQKQVEEQSQTDMVDSQQDAIAAALVSLGYSIPLDVIVAGVSTDSPADGILQPGDIIVSVNGAVMAGTEDLRTAVRANGTSTAATVVVMRGGHSATVQVTPRSIQGSPALGIAVGTAVRNGGTFPVDVKLQLDNVGGPSAGMMFALGIIDRLTPSPLTGGQSVAGTGTIDASGYVGPIGGISQKMGAAQRAGTKWVLAPRCDSPVAVGRVAPGLRVFAVAALAQARAVVEEIADGTASDSLPTCPAH